jgi:DNA-binding response OmpR family regulator
VTTAENAQQARELRQAGVPDLVLLDIWMPDTDGVTLLKEWQRDGLLTMPVIMMSGHATIDTAVEATRIGALNFLEKPIALQKLLKAVQQGLSHSREAVRPASYRPAPVAAVANGVGDGLHAPNTSPRQPPTPLPWVASRHIMAPRQRQRPSAKLPTMPPTSRSTCRCAKRATPSSVPTSNTTWCARTAA